MGVVNEVDCKYVFLRIRAPGFKYAPGQWCRLSIPSLSYTAHPFTIVPDEAEDHVQLFIKGSGMFTNLLCDQDIQTIPSISLLGPFGAPPLPADDIQATIFVLGGVGITPALSLVKVASTSCSGRVRVFWGVRSGKLLNQCAPLLEPYLQPEDQCIRLTANLADEIESPIALLLNARRGRANLDTWLASAAVDFVAQGVSSALIFVCGPPQLVVSTKQAISGLQAVKWQLHVEQFEFLSLPPLSLCGREQTRTQSVRTSQYGDSGDQKVEVCTCSDVHAT